VNDFDLRIHKSVVFGDCDILKLLLSLPPLSRPLIPTALQAGVLGTAQHSSPPSTAVIANPSNSDKTIFVTFINDLPNVEGRKIKFCRELNDLRTIEGLKKKKEAN